MTHELKILPKYFEDVMTGKKNFEIRKNDRDFKVGDYLLLKEYEGASTLADRLRSEYSISTLVMEHTDCRMNTAS